MNIGPEEKQEVHLGLNWILYCVAAMVDEDGELDLTDINDDELDRVSWKQDKAKISTA